jgi:hypothetical protein
LVLLVSEEIVDKLANEYLTKLVDRLYSYMVSYLNAATKHFGWKYLVKPVLEMNIVEFDYGVEVHARVFFDNYEIERLKNAIRRQLEDNRLRIKAYVDVAKRRVKGTGDELYALLSGVRSSPPESHREAGVPGEEVRGEEGGSTPEGSEQGDLRGVQVDEES